MNTSENAQLERWMRDWQAADAPAPSPPSIHAFVRRRARFYAAWVIGEVVVCAGALGLVVQHALRDPDPIEQLTMGLLALLAVGAVSFSLWNWRGTRLFASENTTRFVTLATERSRRFSRAVSAGWVVLGVQLAIFAPWIWYRLYAGPAPASPLAERFAWGFLFFMTTTAILLQLWLRSWARREAHALDQLRREILEDEE
jgi:hypothetical protein